VEDPARKKGKKKLPKQSGQDKRGVSLKGERFYRRNSWTLEKEATQKTTRKRKEEED